MKRAIIRPEKCQNCTPCQIEVSCHMEAVIREAAESRPWIDFYRCAGCMKCKSYCANKAVEEIAHPCDSKGRMGW